MKIKIEKSTSEHLRTIIYHGLLHYRPNELTTRAMHEQLCHLQDKLHNPWTRKSKTFNITCTQALCLQLCLNESAKSGWYDSHVAIVNHYVMEPLLKQVNRI
jgi:hypothetical protein